MSRLNSQTIEASCPTCGHTQTCDRGEYGEPCVSAIPCRFPSCTKHLCVKCPQFECDGCRLTFCEAHIIDFGGELMCAACYRLLMEEFDREAMETA